MTAAVSSFAQWQPAGSHIRTKWADDVNPSAPLPEYPRPQMVRSEWQNLNGLWDYAILPVGEEFAAGQGKILVPFAAESSLSGVGLNVGAENNLWYNRSFTVPKEWKGRRVILHFGAVDWKAEVWVNDIFVASHSGGYSPFEADITDALAGKGANTLTVKVWDPSDKGFQPRGKQVSNPGGIWYTPVTGIWRTVWMEPVAENHISALKITPDLDGRRIIVEASGCSEGIVEAVVKESGKVVARGRAIAGKSASVSIAKPHLWSPEDPYLYDLEVTLTAGGKVVDRVESYCAMRKISKVLDKDCIWRFALNGEPVFLYGPLDQGWWPDGLYTAPTDEALAYDIQKTKDLGFNMIRKHVKVEPDRWYYHCDRLGIIVWQDMPSGEWTAPWQMTRYFDGKESTRTPESEACYRTEWNEIIESLQSHPCICVWVPFNEGWGQFKTAEITRWTAVKDPDRLVNSASGGNHFAGAGDILDLHHYPEPMMYLFDSNRITVLGEYGGIGWPVEGHLWTPDRNWGYIKFTSSNEVTDEYVKYAEQLGAMVSRGFSAAVYTQTTDVEIEVNGLMTYDRKVDKVDVERVRKANEAVRAQLKRRPERQ